MSRSILERNSSDCDTLIGSVPNSFEYNKVPEVCTISVEGKDGISQRRKRLIVCCDTPRLLPNREAHITPYSVSKIPRLSKTFYVEDGEIGEQLVYYDAGLNTALPTNRFAGLFWRVGGAKGLGQEGNVYEAYTFLVQHYSPGDQVFFFGFSEGLYTIETCADIVAKIGICSEGDLSQFWEMYAMHRVHATTDDEPLEQSRWGTPPKSSETPQTSQIALNGRTETITQGAGAAFLSNCQKNIAVMAVESISRADAFDMLEREYFENLEALNQVDNTLTPSFPRRSSSSIRSLRKRIPLSRSHSLRTATREHVLKNLDSWFPHRQWGLT